MSEKVFRNFGYVMVVVFSIAGPGFAQEAFAADWAGIYYESFIEYDIDSDGYLSTAEAVAIESTLFDSWDTNNDDYLSIPELTSTIGLTGLTQFVDPLYGVQKTGTDVVYGTGIVNAGNTQDIIDLYLDRYEPVGEGVPDDRPAIIFVHGGGFIAGDKARETNLTYTGTIKGGRSPSL